MDKKKTGAPKAQIAAIDREVVLPRIEAEVAILMASPAVILREAEGFRVNPVFASSDWEKLGLPRGRDWSWSLRVEPGYIYARYTESTLLGRSCRVEAARRRIDWERLCGGISVPSTPLDQITPYDHEAGPDDTEPYLLPEGGWHFTSPEPGYIYSTADGKVRARLVRTLPGWNGVVNLGPITPLDHEAGPEAPSHCGLFRKLNPEAQKIRQDYIRAKLRQNAKKNTLTMYFGHEAEWED